ncbi:MAG: hypothetical protein JWP34_2502 [Massilia sp.]|nr:hypothetical protein [Massilia sp.]
MGVGARLLVESEKSHNVTTKCDISMKTRQMTEMSSGGSFFVNSGKAQQRPFRSEWSEHKRSPHPGVRRTLRCEPGRPATGVESDASDITNNLLAQQFFFAEAGQQSRNANR